MRNLGCLFLLFFFFSVPSVAQTNFKGMVDYGDYKYEYELSPLPKLKNKYALKINITGNNQPAQLVYQSQASIEGILTKGKQYKIFVLFAEKQNEQWKIDPTSHIELNFDLVDNLMKHSNRGIVAKYEAEELTDVLTVDLANEIITEAQAVDYTLQFIVLNYNQLFGNYAISNPKKKTVQNIGGKRKTIFVSSNDAPSSLRDTISFKNKNYSYQLTETEKNSYSLEIKLVTNGADIANEEIVYNSDLKVVDEVEKKKIYQVKIFYAKGKGYTWRTTPQSFLQTDFNFHKKLTRSQVFGKMQEAQTGKFTPITKFTDKHQYTQKDMLNETIRFFVMHFNKMLLK
jgi:hypothetical protein